MFEIEIELSIKEFCSIFKILQSQYYSNKFNKILTIRHKRDKKTKKYKKVILAKWNASKKQIRFTTKNNISFIKVIEI